MLNSSILQDYDYAEFNPIALDIAIDYHIAFYLDICLRLDRESMGSLEMEGSGQDSDREPRLDRESAGTSASEGSEEEGDSVVSNEEGEASASEEEVAAPKNIKILTWTSLSSVIKAV